MAMLVFVFLLSLLSLPKVWSKSPGSKSELAATVKEDDLRSKRQATFFDLLHQAIEKYANCADQHLTPLKTLASYKQYETLVPDKYSQTDKEITGHPHSEPHKSNLKCTKVNLCITDQNSFTKANNHPGRLEKTLDSEINILKLLAYIPTHGNYKTKLPLHVSSPHGLANPPKTHSVAYSQNNQPHNQDFFKLLFRKPTAAGQKKLLKIAESEAILGNTVPTKTVNSWLKIPCTCLNKTATDTRLPASNTHDGKNSCPCSEIVTRQAQTDSTRLESDELLGGTANTDLTPSELKEFNQNLNLLLMQLDEIAERTNNGELKQLLEKLKDLKSAFDINFENENDHSSATTTEPLLVGAQVSQQAPNPFADAPNQFSFSNSGMGLLNTMFKDNRTKKGDKSANSATEMTETNSNEGKVVDRQANIASASLVANKDFHGKNIEDHKNSGDSPFLEESHTKKKSSQLISENVQEAATETSVPEKAPFESQNLPKSQDVNLVLTRSPSMTNKNSQHLTHPRYGTHILESSLENKRPEDFYKEPFFGIISESPMSAFKISDKKNKINNFAPSRNFYNKQPKMKEVYFAQTPAHSTKGKTTQTHHVPSETNYSKPGKKDSKITISITSNGSFKHIHMEQHLPDDENLEINEKEKMNMGTPNFKGHFKDMQGTGSRLVNVVKQPQKNESYTEPILLQIYPAKSKSSNKKPPSIYWHKIEKQPPKLNGTLKGVWQTFQSTDVFDRENVGEENLATDENTKKSSRGFT